MQRSNHYYSPVPDGNHDADGLIARTMDQALDDPENAPETYSYVSNSHCVHNGNNVTESKCVRAAVNKLAVAVDN